MSDRCSLKAVARGPLKASLLTRGSVYGCTWNKVGPIYSTYVLHAACLTAALMMICWMKATGLVSAHLGLS